MCDQVVFGGVGFLAHAALPALLTATHIYIVAVIHMHVQLFRFAGFLAPPAEPHGFGGVEGVRREMEERERDQTGMERMEVGSRRAQEYWRRRPQRQRLHRLLLHLDHTMETQAVEVDHTWDESVRPRHDGARERIGEERKVNASAGEVLWTLAFALGRIHAGGF